MEFRSYNRELAYANMLFKRPFSNIAIERDGKLIKFKCLFGNRSRIFKNMENPLISLKIPSLIWVCKIKKYLQKVYLLEKNRKFVPYFADGMDINFRA